MVDALGILTSIAEFTQAAGSEESANRPPLLATVNPAHTSGAPKVTFDGESTMSTKTYPYLGSYSPAAGDRVLLMPVGTTYMIIGSVSTGAEAGLPAGVIQAYAKATAPTGWLLCDGAAVSRTTYARLFAAIGVTWGPGNGSTTFNVPDLRGRMVLGAGSGAGLTPRTFAASGGAEAHTTAVAHTHTGPSHTHTGPSHTHTGPSHSHSIPSHTHTGPSHTHTTPDHTHSIPIANTQQSTNVTAGPTGYTVTAIGGTTGSDGAGNTGSGGTGATGSGGSGTTGTEGTGATGAGGTGATGADGTGATGSTGSASVDHMPPFAAVTHIIKI